MQSFILLAIVAVASATTMMNFNAEHSFTGFKAKFARNYKSASEEATRLAIFNKNLAYIAKHNARTDTTFTVGVNQFADLVSSWLIKIDATVTISKHVVFCFVHDMNVFLF